MARKLSLKTNVDPAVFPFPFGRIRNNSGIGDGTPVDEDVYGDMHQFFEGLLILGSVTANNLPESASNGFQYSIALQNMLNIQTTIFHQVGGSFEPPYQNGFVTSAFITALDGMRYRVENKLQRVFFQGACQRATEANNSTVFTLPLGYRPATERALPILMRNNGVFVPGIMKIATNGNVTFSCNAGDAATTAVYIVDGVSFNIN